MQPATKWAVQFDNGELHRYSAKQLLDKFGVDEVRVGMKIDHKTRGRATVMMSFADDHINISPDSLHEEADGSLVPDALIGCGLNYVASHGHTISLHLAPATRPLDLAASDTVGRWMWSRYTLLCVHVCVLRM